ALLEANDRPNAELLARNLDMHIAFGEANSPFHIAWLTRRPVLRRHNYRLPALAKTLLEIELPWEGTEGSEGPEPPALHLFATHHVPVRLSACDVVTDGRAAPAPDHFPVWAQFD